MRAQSLQNDSAELSVKQKTQPNADNKRSFKFVTHVDFM